MCWHCSKCSGLQGYSSGKKAYIMELKHQKSTTFDPGRSSVNSLADPNNNCSVSGSDLKQQVVGEEVINGYRTVEITSGPITQWLALDYGCAVVKDRAEWGDGQVSEKKLIALIPGEPSASLFD